MDKIKVRITCKDEFINKHSDGGKYYGWSNPFGDFIPIVGDIVELGEEPLDKEESLKKEGKQYKIIRRTFKAYESCNGPYKKQVCVLEVEEII